MTSKKFDSVFNLISQYSFVFDYDTNYWNCVICKNLINDPAVSNVCGCQYCYKCITEYLAGNVKHCPGTEEDCKRLCLVVNKNLFRSLLLNKQISNLTVKCPNQLCWFRTELMNMSEHLRSCNNHSIECPFTAIGCVTEQGNEASVKRHLDSDVLNHSKLLLEYIVKLDSDMKTLKCDLEESKLKEVVMNEAQSKSVSRIESVFNEQMAAIKKEFVDVKQESKEIITVMCDFQEDTKKNFEKNNLKIMLVKDDLLKMKNELEMRVDKKTERIKEVITKQRGEFDSYATVVNDSRRDIKVNFSKNNFPSVPFKEEFGKMINELEIRLNKEMERMKTEMSKQNQETQRLMTIVNNTKQDLKSDYEEMKFKLSSLSENSTDNERNVPRLEDDWPNQLKKEKEVFVQRRQSEEIKILIETEDMLICKVYKKHEADFVWRINDYTTKFNTRLYSDSFYANNYKYCLFMYTANYSDYIHLYCYIMNGKYDDKLEWPSTRAVTLSIINQGTLEAHKSLTFSGQFYRADKDLGGNLGGFFITFSSVNFTKSVIVDDSIVVTCSIFGSDKKLTFD